MLERRIQMIHKMYVIFLMQEMIFMACPEEDIDVWLEQGMPDGMEFSDAIDFYLDMPEEVTRIYNLGIRLLRGVEF